MLPVPPKWVMVIDSDEFLVLRKKEHTSVVNFLQEHLQSGSLHINWIIMGSANETSYRPEPVTKRFQYVCICPAISRSTKAIAVLDHVTGWRVHSAIMKRGYGAIGMGGRKISMGNHVTIKIGNETVPYGDVSVAALYHYKYKSAEEYTFKTCVRGPTWGLPNTCQSNVQIGSEFDDRAWQAMRRLVPKYDTLLLHSRKLPKGTVVSMRMSHVIHNKQTITILNPRTYICRCA
jgi:hypothetical protein